MKQTKAMRQKEALIALSGGECFRCGFSGVAAAFDFHHVIPKNKLYAISTLCGRRDEDFENYAVPEAREKCVLLCKNCHALIHTDKDESSAVARKWIALKERTRRRVEKAFGMGLLVAEKVQ